MVYIALFIFAYSTLLTTESVSSNDDTTSVFVNETYLNLPSQFLKSRDLSTAYNPVTDHVYVYDTTSSNILWEFKPDGSVSVLDTLLIPEVNKEMPMDVSHSGDAILLWELGLGKVFRYTLSDSSLKQIDQTRVQDLMVGHGSVLMRDGRILAQGGYGFWEYRNFLLEFNSENGEWNKIEPDGLSPETPSTLNFLGYIEEENRLIYLFVPLSAIQQDSDVREIHTFEPFFEVYTFHVETKKWTHRNSIYPKDTNLGLRMRPRSRATHSVDYSRGTFVFDGRLAVDINTYELFYISHPSINDLQSENYYYSENSDRWIVIGRNSGVSRQHLVVRSFPASEAQLIPLEEELPAYIVWLGWFSGGILFLALIYVGVDRWRKSTGEEDTTTPKKIELAEKHGELTVAVGGKNLDLSDPIFKEFFSVVYEMKKREKSEILMSEFDNKIFTDQHSQPFRSKVKKKMFKLVNSKLEDPFITIDVYPLDKRYKMIVIDLEAIYVVSTKNLTLMNGVNTSV